MRRSLQIGASGVRQLIWPLREGLLSYTRQGRRCPLVPATYHYGSHNAKGYQRVVVRVENPSVGALVALRDPLSRGAIGVFAADAVHHLRACALW